MIWCRKMVSIVKARLNQKSYEQIFNNVFINDDVMSFYIKPPRGQINFHKLEECVKQRLDCYDRILSKENDTEITSFDCLLEDSVLDRTGHFLFRLMAYCSISFRNIFLQNEQRLLLLRLNCYSKNDLRYFLKTLQKQLKDVLKEHDADRKANEMYTEFLGIFFQMSRKHYLTHIFDESRIQFEYCEEFTVRVPFYLCASLIYNREVKLHKGFAEIQCKDWKKLLLSLYLTFLKRVLEQMKYSRNVQMTLDDDRVREVLKLIKNHWFEDGYSGTAGVKFDVRKIEVESKLFPICMLNLYKVLQNTNRLSHNERFDFSLYMKGIGVSLSDSLKFWKTAYCKQHVAHSKCTHDWEKNEKRYIYGIRHLYGLEGSRKNYCVRSCSYFQENVLSATEHGGCPFKHFDDSNLRKALKRLVPGKEDDVEVMIYERKENPSGSCKLFYESVFRTLTNRSIDRGVAFHNPVDYYLSLRNVIAENGATEVGVSSSQSGLTTTSGI